MPRHRAHAAAAQGLPPAPTPWRRLPGLSALSGLASPRWHAASVLPALAFAAPAPAVALRAVLGHAAHGGRDPVLRMVGQGFGVVYLPGAAAGAPLTRRELRRAGLSEPALHQHALDNLAALADHGPHALHCLALPRRLFALTLGGVHASSLVLLNALWDERIAARLAGPPVVGIPSRELCLFTDVSDPRALRALRQFITRLACDPQRRQQLLSSALFVRCEHRWSRLDGA